jgi:hypothetical protein
MSYKLVVVHPFQKYKKGQEITDQAEINKLNEQHRTKHCVRVAIKA